MSFRKVSEKQVFSGPVVDIFDVVCEGPDGERFERQVARHGGAVSVVPIETGDDGEPVVVLVRQYRSAVDEWLLEIPAGRRDKEGEPAEETAARELIEEAGLKPGRIEKLTEFYNSPGFTDQRSIVFMATELTPVDIERDSVEEQHMTIERFPLREVPDLIKSGKLLDGESMIGLMLAMERVGA